MQGIAQYKSLDPASRFFWQARYLSLSPGHQKALQLRLPATQAASSACQPVLAVLLLKSLWRWPSLTLVAAALGVDASPRLCLMSPDFGASRQRTCVYLKCAQPHWSLCALRTSVCVRREGN